MLNKSIFSRPEEPVKLSQFDISKQIKGGADVFCGKCNNPIKVNYSIGIIYDCNCLSSNITQNINHVSSLRVVNNQIISDIFVVSNSEFDPEIHSPSTINLDRMSQWNTWHADMKRRTH